MYCPECGNELLGKVKFCHECGFNILKYINESDNQGGSQEIQEPDPPLLGSLASNSREITEEATKVNRIVPKPDNRDNLLHFNSKYKIDIGAMIILSIITAWLYGPIWIYRRHEMLELRIGTKKIKKSPSMVAILFGSLLLCTSITLFFIYSEAPMVLRRIYLIFWVTYIPFYLISL